MTETNIEVSNGYVHLIKSALIPISRTTYEWLEQRDDFSIFTDAVEATGLSAILDVNIKEDEEAEAVTLLLEDNHIFAGRDIYSFEDLAAWISPGEDNYTDPANPLYGFVAYHILEGSSFLDDFAETASNYTTYSEVPVLINGLGLDITINNGKEIFVDVDRQRVCSECNGIGGTDETAVQPCKGCKGRGMKTTMR